MENKTNAVEGEAPEVSIDDLAERAISALKGITDQGAMMYIGLLMVESTEKEGPDARVRFISPVANWMETLKRCQADPEAPAELLAELRNEVLPAVKTMIAALRTVAHGYEMVLAEINVENPVAAALEAPAQ